MPVRNADVEVVVQICQQHQHRVRYGVLGAALGTRAGNPNALPRNYASATVSMLNATFGGRGPAGSWVVAGNGLPTGYGPPPNPLYDLQWNEATPVHQDVEEFLDWLDAISPGWDGGLLSTFP